MLLMLSIPIVEANDPFEDINRKVWAFNEFLDDIYAWFNLLFSSPGTALVQLFSGYFGGILSVGDFIVDM